MIGDIVHFLAGMALVLAGWLMPRRIAASPPVLKAALPLDLAPMAAGVALLLAATGRPLFAGFVILILGAGLALADRTMRATLHEPVVFSEMSELPQIFTHPHLYLPFAGPGLVIGGALGGSAVGVMLLLYEPALWEPRPITMLAAAGLIVAGGWLFSREPLLGALAQTFRRLNPSDNPATDATELGPFAMLIVHCVIARAERRSRQLALAAPAIVGCNNGCSAPVVLVQCESFFDARRLSPSIPEGSLEGFDACCRGAAMHGRLDVPGWGANTMRSEFAVLTGIPESALGYDRFNPYYALARVPIASQVWRLRQAGYRTICLHPFDGRFFRRDLVMPALGFEKFLCRETLGGSRVPPYFPDPELADHVLRVLDAEGPRTFIFVITMDNHGPWRLPAAAADPHAARILDPAVVPQGRELLGYLDGLRRSDRMLQILMQGLAQRNQGAILAFYGDHLPSLPHAFSHFGFDEPHSDYVIWPGEHSAPPQRIDLPAHELGRLVVDRLLAAEDTAIGQKYTARRAAPALGALLDPR
jgi:hypothetical protein